MARNIKGSVNVGKDLDVANNITVTGTVDGRDVATDGTKLDGVASSATVDQNVWETVAGDTGSVAANTTTDTLTIAGGTNISTSISGDTVTITSTGATLPVVDTTSLVEGSVDATKEMRIEVDGLTTGTVRVLTMPDNNVDLGADFATAAQGTTADAALPKAGGAMTGAITTSSTFDGRDVATDGTKLDAIEAAADVTDATNVAGAGAVMDSDISEGEGFLRKTGSGAYEGIKSNLTATTAPGATDDTGSGYAVGSLWIDVTGDAVYQAVDITSSAAVWKNLSASASGIANIVEDTTPQLGGDLDANGSQIQWSKGADVASATALAVLTDGNYFDVTGTTTITSINTTGGAGTVIKLHFDGIVTLTHHATNLILPGAANVTTAAGDEFEFTEYGAGTYRCTGYALASGSAIVGGGGGISNVVEDTTPQLGGNLDINTKSFIDENGNTLLSFATSSGATRNIEIRNDQFNQPRIVAVGSDTNIDLGILAKGTGKLKVFPVLALGGVVNLPTTDGSANQVMETNGSGTVTWVTPAGGSNWILANNNTDFTTAPVSTGTNSIAIGNAATTAGTSNSIAIGTSADGTEGIAIGNAADASQASCIAIGASSDAGTTAGAIAIGSPATATGSNSIAIGKSCTATATNSIAFSQADSTHAGAVVFGKLQDSVRGGEFAIGGDRAGIRASKVVYRALTSSATAAEASYEGTNKLAIKASSVVRFKGTVVAKKSGTSFTRKVWDVDGVIQNDNGTTALIGSVTKTVIADPDTKSWDVTITADDTNDILKIEVTGEAATSVWWAINIDTTEVIL